ncbi:hypothetical protein RCJ22_24890, partial [Vibrio sp. FNV 38]|nr:hypothetical protein [Vibrio sp. FNV 38]
VGYRCGTEIIYIFQLDITLIDGEIVVLIQMPSYYLLYLLFCSAYQGFDFVVRRMDLFRYA